MQDRLTQSAKYSKLIVCCAKCVEQKKIATFFDSKLFRMCDIMVNMCLILVDMFF